jgi:hypothetical protein
MKIIITERQTILLKESLPVGLRRRIFKSNYLQDHLDFTLLESLNPCEWDDTNHFIGDVCTTLVDDILDDYYYETKELLSRENRDELHWYFVDTFSDHIRNFHKQQCA